MVIQIKALNERYSTKTVLYIFDNSEDNRQFETKIFNRNVV